MTMPTKHTLRDQHNLIVRYSHYANSSYTVEGSTAD